MPLPQKPARRGSRLGTAVAVSVLAHLLLLPFIARDAIFQTPKQTKKQFVSLVPTPRGQVQRAQGPFTSSGATPQSQQAPQLPLAIKPPEPEKLEKIEGQVVALGPPQDERAPERPTRYLSEHDSRVLKESRARETSAFFKNALSKTQKEGRKEKVPQGQAPVSEKPGDEGHGGGEEQRRQKQEAQLPNKPRRDSLHIKEHDDGTVRSREASDALQGQGTKVAIADPGQEARPSSVGPGVPGAGEGKPGARTPLRLTLDSPIIGSLGPLAGGAMPDDLRGVEEGDETLLNSRSFKFAGFLNRVKETVGRVWVQRVQDEAGKRDPSGQIFSYKDRRTVVEFTLDRAGEITEVKVGSSCGVPYLDSVAVDAFRVVQRFPNPPPGLVGESGTVRLPFAFTLLAATGGMRLQVGPAYLPGSPAARGF